MLTLSVLENPNEGFAAEVAAALRGAVTVALGGAGDVVVVSPEYRGSVAVQGGAVVLPHGHGAAVYGVGAVPQGAANVVTYGMSPNATLALSSVGEVSAMLAVQREITTPQGAVVEEQELRVSLNHRAAVGEAEGNALNGVESADATLAAAGATIMLGLFPNSDT